MKQLCPIETLKDLVGFKSISKQSNADIVDYLEQICAALGFTTVRIKSENEPVRFNLLARIGPDLPGGLMLSGHTDVVPVLGQSWHTDPFTLTEKNGVLYGRGTADMKGFIAAAVSALSNFPLPRLRLPLTLLFTYDEEVGCVGSAQASPMLKQYMTHLPKSAIIGEPTDFNILRMHAGHVTIKLSIKGKGAHSSNPDLGISAIKALNHALSGVFALEQELRAELSLAEHFDRPFVIMNVGEVYGGTAVNIIPDEAFATIGFRPLPDIDTNKMFERIESACKKNQPDHRAQISVSFDKISPPMFTNNNTELESILRPLANSTGPSAAQFSTDGGNIAKSGIECLLFGPGGIDVAHQANEWIRTSDLFLAQDKLTRILETLI